MQVPAIGAFGPKTQVGFTGAQAAHAMRSFVARHCEVPAR
jgi:hypothetical protein